MKVALLTTVLVLGAILTVVFLVLAVSDAKYSKDDTGPVWDDEEHNDWGSY